MSMGTPTPQELRDELARVRKGSKAWERRFELEAARRQQALDDAARTHDSLEIWKAQAVAMEAKAERAMLKVAELEQVTSWMRTQIREAEAEAARLRAEQDNAGFIPWREAQDNIDELTAALERLTKAATALVVLWDEWDQAGDRHVRDDIVERMEAAEDVLRAALDRGSSSPGLDQPDPPLWQQDVVRSQGMCGALVRGADGRDAVCILSPGHDPSHPVPTPEVVHLRDRVQEDA